MENFIIALTLLSGSMITNFLLYVDYRHRISNLRKELGRREEYYESLDKLCNQTLQHHEKPFDGMSS